MKRSWVSFSSVALFWLWNVVFICITLLLIPSLFGLLRILVASEDIALDYLLIMSMWMVVPVASVVFALKKLRHKPQALAFYFFAIEGPFFGLCCYRLIAMRELTPAVAQWLLMLVLGLCVCGFDLLVRPLPAKRGWQAVRLSATICLILVMLCISVVLLLPGLPLGLSLVGNILNPVNWGRFLSDFLSHPLLILALLFSGVLFLISLVSLLLMPLALLRLCWAAVKSTWFDRIFSRPQYMVIVLATLLVQTLVYVRVNQQPQMKVFTQLDGAITPVDFHAQQPALRAGLLNAYLAHYRYASSVTQSNAIQKLYPDGRFAEGAQKLFNLAIRPFLYNGDIEADTEHAALLYERYFDTPIQRGERDAIAKALSATHDRDEREAGLINIDQRKVRVESQQIQVKQEGDLARITLNETYVNLTQESQEIFYLFSLPQSAAITGLWLGNSLNEMQPHTVATRGAAQRVYKAEVQKRIDPALLEQVGPRQYRLRAFPVPPKARDKNAATPKLYLRLEYTTLPSDGAWPLPVLAEKRNVAWDQKTQRDCNGNPCLVAANEWWPRSLAAKVAPQPAVHIFSMGPQGPSVIAQAAKTLPVTALQGKKITLVVDRSMSMSAHRGALLEAMRLAKEQLSGQEVSVLLTTTSVMQTKPQLMALSEFNPDTLGLFIGGGHAGELLQQTLEHSPQNADLTLVLTDHGAFDLKTKHEPLASSGMLSFVHLGGVLAPVYDDQTLATVQASGGSSFVTLNEAWAHFVRTRVAEPGYLMTAQGYDFSMLSTASATTSDEFFAPIAVRLLVAQATREKNGKELSPSRLDTLHEWARRHSVVTPYSSMIVLVNAQQQAALDKAQTEGNRFDRETEQGTEKLGKPFNPFVTATPEPEEWLLMLVSFMGLAWMLSVRRKNLHH
jgi:putative PEP-CTERM system integral membrane protein